MTNKPVIEVERNQSESRFEVHLDGETAFLEYKEGATAIVMPHTVVPEAFEGKGVASAMARSALDWARSTGKKVVPSCTFVAGYIDKHPEYQDLVAA